MAQETQEDRQQLQRTIFRLQQKLLELQENFDKQSKELIAQKEKLSILLETVSTDNEKLLRQLKKLRTQVYQFEYRLESGSLIRLQQDIQDLKDLQQIVLLETINGPEQTEKLLLNIVNDPNSTIPKDILILKLAQLKFRKNKFQESTGYYSTLLTEFPESQFFSQAIFELSENFGRTGKLEEQETLLLQLSTLSSLDIYTQKAISRLKEMGIEPLISEKQEEPAQIENQDTTGDIILPSQDSSGDTILPDQDTTGDTTLPSQNNSADSIIQPELIESASEPVTIVDSTGDNAPSSIEDNPSPQTEQTLDTPGESTTFPLPENPPGDNRGLQKTPGSTGDETDSSQMIEDVSGDMQPVPAKSQDNVSSDIPPVIKTNTGLNDATNDS